MLRREAHALVDGKPYDDTAELENVRSTLGKLFDDRDSPTWAFDLARRLEPASAPLRKAMAARLIELGRTAQAEPLVLAITEGKASDPQAWLDRGLFLARAGQTDRAAADFARALELSPVDFQTWGTRAKLCFSMAQSPSPTTACSNCGPPTPCSGTSALSGI